MNHSIHTKRTVPTELSVWAYPWDIADEGAATALDWLSQHNFTGVDLCHCHVFGEKSPPNPVLFGTRGRVLPSSTTALRTNPSQSARRTCGPRRIRRSGDRRQKPWHAAQRMGHRYVPTMDSSNVSGHGHRERVRRPKLCRHLPSPSRCPDLPVEFAL